MKSLKKHLLVFTHLLTCVLVLSGQQPDPEVAFNTTNPDNSDYRVLLTFSYNNNYCNCGQQSTTISIYDAPFIGDLLETYNAPHADVTLVVGPNFSAPLTANFAMSGERTWLGTSGGLFCVNTICAGIPAACPCDDLFLTPGVDVSTAALKNPTNVTATVGAFLDKIVLTWGKGTNFPNNQHDYKIYRDGNLVATVPGSGPYTYTDTGLTQGEVHDYTVKTHISSYGDQESTGVTSEGSTFLIDASDGDFYNRVRVRWSNVPDGTEDVRIERSTHDANGVVTGREEVVIMSASATAYNDQGGIPGFSYSYYVTPLVNSTPIIEYSDDGYSKPNGKITGHVRSLRGAGVQGVDIAVEIQTTIPAGGGTLPGGCTTTYCTSTDVEGYYEIQDVYYYSEADFRVTASDTGHVITPVNISRILNENAHTADGLDFTDETVFTVGGRVTFPNSPNNVVCGVSDASIIIDGNDFGIKTDENGDWLFTIPEEDTLTFTVDYYNHRFEDMMGNTATSILVNQDSLNLNFEDKEVGDITVVAQGGCLAPLGNSVLIQVAAPGGCFLQTYYTNAQGTLTIEDLPARDYVVKVLDIEGALNPSNILAQIGGDVVSIGVDLTTKDSVVMIMDRDTTIITPEQIDTFPNQVIIVTPADTQMLTVQDTILKPANSSARFIYRSPLLISVDFQEAGATLTTCLDSEGEEILIMEEGEQYFLSIEVSESLDTDCLIDSGFLKIYDFISDRGDNFVRVPIVHGIASYVITAGDPDLATSGFRDHEKLFYIVPEVDQLVPEPVEYWALVTGVQSGVSTFFTRTPDLPMLVIHDPPGDNSYAFVEKGQSFKSFTKTSLLKGGAGGIFANVQLGTKINLALVKAKVAGFLEFSLVGGRDDINDDGLEVTMEFTETFSTSSADNFTGDEGDVYIGASFNHEMAIGTSLEYDPIMCEAVTSNKEEIADIGFATTFYYTEKHIKNTLLPTIALLMDLVMDDEMTIPTPDDTVQFNRLRADSVGWVRILAQNELNRDSLAVQEENLSFSAGASVDRSWSTDSTSSHSHEYEVFLEGDFAAGVDAEVEGFGGYFKAKGGAMGRFKTSTTTLTGNDTTATRTVGFVLDDGDIGDFFSVDVKRDTAFNVPSFDLVLGTSSCPHEVGTQSRDKPTIVITPPELPDVPADGEATFVARLTNRSESMETREYHVRVVSTTNPDGALLNLGGRNINNGPASFFLEYNQTLNVALTVKKGPLASNYVHVGVMMYPPCEYALWQDNGDLKNVDTAYITINFQSECTNVNLFNPGDGWLVNQNDNDTLHTTFTGYDINNPKFQSLTLQFKREGEGYVDQLTVLKSELSGPFYDAFFDVSNFEDGNYRLRARANCTPGTGYTYSSEQSGIIDRESLAPFGTPSPSDGFLQEGQEISVTYDKEINCNFGDYMPDISLVREDTDAPLAFDIECLNKKLILVTNPPLVDMPDLDGVNVTARTHLLQDLNGNVQKYPVEWTFKVNAKPVFWDPDLLYASAKEGESTIMTGVLKNDALLSKSFSLEVADEPTIISFPDWLTPLQTRGTVLSNNDFEVDFAVDPDLSPGIYQGVVTAAVDSLPVSMDVIYELLAKPVNWSFDPNLYENSMNVVAQFSLTLADTPLSEDTRDLIGAFVNGEIRGIANIEYIPAKNSYAAFLTVYSDDDGGNNGEVIQFRYWHSLSGVEYKALETLPFQPDDANGTVEAPFILHPEGIFQVIPLNIGWNWISFNVETQDMSREKIFESVISAQSTNSILIKSQNKSTEYNPSSGWLGNLQDLELGVGYLVHLSDHLDTLRVSGFPPLNTVPIDLSQAWNWIGFPEQIPRPVGDVLSGATVTPDDLLKGQHVFAGYDASTSSWIGNLSFFEPGKGYKLSLAINSSAELQNGNGNAIPAFYEHNMNITGVLSPDMVDHASAEDLKVRAYINDICYGDAELEYVAVLDEYRVLLLINGSDLMQDAEVELRVINERTEKQYFGNGVPLQFTLDGIIGNVMEPYEILRYVPESHGLGDVGYELMQNIPNPARESTTIKFRIPVSENVTIEIFDTNGNLMLKAIDRIEDVGLQSVQFSLQDLPDGIYFYRMITPNFSATKKLVKN